MILAEELLKTLRRTLFPDFSSPESLRIEVFDSKNAHQANAHIRLKGAEELSAFRCDPPTRFPTSTRMLGGDQFWLKIC